MRLAAESVLDAFGLAVVAWRKRAGMTQGTFARACGLGPATMSRIEAGTAHLSTVHALRGGVDLAWLVAEAERIARRDGVDWPRPATDG